QPRAGLGLAAGNRDRRADLELRDPAAVAADARTLHLAAELPPQVGVVWIDVQQVDQSVQVGAAAGGVEGRVAVAPVGLPDCHRSLYRQVWGAASMAGIQPTDSTTLPLRQPSPLQDAANTPAHGRGTVVARQTENLSSKDSSWPRRPRTTASSGLPLTTSSCASSPTRTRRPA